MPLGLTARSGSRIYRAAATKSSSTLTSLLERACAIWSDQGCAPLSPDVAGANERTGHRLRTGRNWGRGKAAKSAVAVDQSPMSRWRNRTTRSRMVRRRFSRCRPVRRSAPRSTKTRSLFPRDLARTDARAGPGDRHRTKASDAIRHLPLRWRADLVRRSLAEALHAAALRCSAGGRCRSAPAARPRSRRRGREVWAWRVRCMRSLAITFSLRRPDG